MDVDLLRSLFNYDSVSGLLTWKEDQRNGSKAGSMAGCLHKNKRKVYRRIMIRGVSIYAHQVAWAIFYGEWPKFIIDHEDRDGLNNGIKNLRRATNAQNLHNSDLYKSNTSGYKGVCWNDARQKWHAYIYQNRKRIDIGYFDTAEKANANRFAAAVRLMGEFACGGVS